MLQFVLSLVTIPAISVLQPPVLYRPELAPTPGDLVVLLGVTLLTAVIALAAWFPRISIRAPREQQQEAEARA
jgi:hypothetical protein